MLGSSRPLSASLPDGPDLPEAIRLTTPSYQRILAWHSICRTCSIPLGQCGPALCVKARTRVRIIVEVPDLEPGRTKSHAVANYLRAALRVQALRSQFALAVLDMRRCKEALACRSHAGSLMSEAEALCEALGISKDVR